MPLLLGSCEGEFRVGQAERRWEMRILEVGTFGYLVLA
jgi:hypothetical protein